MSWRWRMTRRILWTAALVAATGCSGASSVAETPEAITIVDALHARLGGWPRRALPHAGHAAKLSLPATADGAFTLANGEMAIRVTLRDVRPTRAEGARGHVVYRNALPGGGHLVQRPTAVGTEDYLLLTERTPVVYDVALERGVAGLRQIGDALELLDGAGAPRLRVAPPWVVGADGTRVDAHLAVEGCALDRDARAPWNRAVVAPGAAACSVRVVWPDVQLP